ncbi:hypothetical protein ABZP36_001207 [Zizania latifolia]
MAATESTLIIEVDLACGTCYTKIQKVLCKIQVKENIKSISYETSKNEVVISGSFNAHALYHTLRCKVGCAIKGYKIPEKTVPPPVKPKVTPPVNTTVNLEFTQTCVLCHPGPCRCSHGGKGATNDGDGKDKQAKTTGKVVATTEGTNTTVNLQFTQSCVFCYPWPCRCREGGDPVVCAPPPPKCNPVPPPPPKCCAVPPPPPKCCAVPPPPPKCHAVPPPPPKCNDACAGPSQCGGCGKCGGGGGYGWWPPMPMPPPCCSRPGCRGCNGGRVLHEQKFEYSEARSTARPDPDVLPSYAPIVAGDLAPYVNISKEMTELDMPILIIKAKLECGKCYKKIHKVLCKLKDKEKITKIDFDNQNNKITLTGSFDALQLAHKLRCKAGEVIKEIEIGKETKPDDKKPEPKKEEKKPEAKKEEKKPDDGKEKKVDEKQKPKDDAKAAVAPSSSTTVNLQFTQMCGICYPWPCSDPSHRGGGHPQWPSDGMAFAGHQHPPWGAVAPTPTPMKWPCGGPSYCGGCDTCRGGGNGMHGWPAMPPPPQMCCPGPSSCRGCKGCRIVQEGKFVYEEYPPNANACAIM